jgi:integrase
MARRLWKLRKQTRAGDGELVFPAERGGRIAHSNAMRRLLKPAAIAAGLGQWVKEEGKERRPETWVGFHSFRHTAATILFRAGWNAVQVHDSSAIPTPASPSASTFTCCRRTCPTRPSSTS